MKTPIIQCDPIITPEVFNIQTAGSDAIVVVGFATGQVPERLLTVIKARVDEGIPVFLLKDNFGRDHGVLDPLREIGRPLVETGIIPLEHINVNGLVELIAAIQEEAGAGKTGAELGEAIQQRYTYGSNEAKPIPEWEIPGRLEAMRKRTKFSK